jgi:hypothetical protein
MITELGGKQYLHVAPLPKPPASAIEQELARLRLLHRQLRGRSSARAKLAVVDAQIAALEATAASETGATADLGHLAPGPVKPKRSHHKKEAQHG